MRPALRTHRFSVPYRRLVALLFLVAAVLLGEGGNRSFSACGEVAVSEGDCRPAEGQEGPAAGHGEVEFEQGDDGDGILTAERPTISPLAPSGREPGFRTTTSSRPVLDVPFPVPI